MALANRSMALGLGAVLLMMLSATHAFIQQQPRVVQLSGWSEAGYVIGTKAQ